MDMTIHADVAIIGGGPAGTMAAMALAENCIDTLLLDKSGFPRDKPCGGGISRRLFTRFPTVSDYIKESVPAHDIQRVVLESPDGTQVISSSQGPLFTMVRRYEFDHALLRLAIEKGAAVHENSPVRDISRTASGFKIHAGGGKIYQCKILIGADGVNSIVARRTGIRKRWKDDQAAINTMEETPVQKIKVSDPSSMYVFYGYEGVHGYAYIFPKLLHTDLGTGFLLSHYKKHFKEKLYPFHSRFVKKMTERGLISGASDRASFQTHLIPLCGPVGPNFGDRVLLCGDAGGFVHGFTAEGIYYAMVSGYHAGQTATQAIINRDFTENAFRAYERAWEKEIGGELKQSVKIREILFRRPDIINAVIRTARYDRKLAGIFRDVAIGEAGVDSNKFSIIMRFLRAILFRKISLKSVLSILGRK